MIVSKNVVCETNAKKKPDCWEFSVVQIKKYISLIFYGASGSFTQKSIYYQIKYLHIKLEDTRKI